MKAARFVTQHHAVLEAVLKEAAAAHTLSLALLEEARAVTALVFFIARQRAVLDRDAAMAAGSAGHAGVTLLHLPMLALLPKLATSSGWTKRLVPTNDVERMQIVTAAADAEEESESILGHQAAVLVDAVVGNAMAYAQAVTEQRAPYVATSGGGGRPAFSCDIEHSRESDYLPSLATLVAFVRRSLKRIEGKRAVRDEKLRLARNTQDLSTAALRELVVVGGGDLGVQQMRVAAARVLEKQAALIGVAELLEALEQALVLLWRHLSLFIGGGGSVLLLEEQEREMLRSDASIALPPILALLSELKVDEFGKASATHVSFIQMLVRRIKDLVLRDGN
ncbi:hypothetical protein GGI21_006428 [Coemansia aciculifera]|nr:hypothetical protein GGI21_006428 [Coemansia aciculifera]